MAVIGIPRKAAVLVLAAGLLLALALRPAPAAAEPTPLPSGTVKFYVVQTSVGGQPEYLFAIATRLLGDGRRAGEIFELNKGRRQPDGAALVDPAVLHAGWILRLPDDAKGDGVLLGPLPSADAASTPAAGGTPPARPAESGAAAAVRAISLAGVVGLMLAAIVALRRGRRIRLRRRPRRPPNRTPVRAAAGPAGPKPVGADRPAREEPAQPAREDLIQPVREEPARELVPIPVPAPALAAAPVARPTPAGTLVDDRPAGFNPDDQIVDVVVATRSGADRATVRLAGARAPGTEPAWVWLAADAALPACPTSVPVGTGEAGTLCVDLARAPDVLTVTGDAGAGRRLAADLAGQLAGRGVRVAAVGPVLGAPVAGAEALGSLAEAEAAVEAEADPAGPAWVVFCPPGEDPALVLRLSARHAPRTVVVFVGHARSSRWSFEAQPAR
ncbi:hypothetical protein [Dactylosporangium sp. CA-092794]|uniref:hypothetical protein n=1 Tax=Dactylosporangium sp. CA-092794 TaxID=3239929 RepID=UPI003D8DCC35